MRDIKLKKEMDEAINQKPNYFWSIAVSAFSFLYGTFIVRFDGYLLNYIEPQFRLLPVQILGSLLIIVSVIKIAGILSCNRYLKRFGIWGLSSTWSALFFFSVTYSFGTGYPDSGYLFNGFILVICLYISFKGDFKK